MRGEIAHSETAELFRHPPWSIEQNEKLSQNSSRRSQKVPNITSDMT